MEVMGRVSEPELVRAEARISVRSEPEPELAIDRSRRRSQDVIALAYIGARQNQEI